MTELILANRGPLADPLIAAAGTDVSHWFSLSPPSSSDGGKKRKPGGGSGSAKSGPNNTPAKEDGEGGGDRREDEFEIAGDPRTFVDPQTGLTVPYLPMGRLVGKYRANGFERPRYHTSTEGIAMFLGRRVTTTCYRNVDMWQLHLSSPSWRSSCGAHVWPLHHNATAFVHVNLAFAHVPFCVSSSGPGSCTCRPTSPQPSGVPTSASRGGGIQRESSARCGGRPGV